MKKEELIRLVINDSFSQDKMLSDLQRLLDEELKKPQINYDYVAEITAAIREISEGETIPQENDESQINAILNEINLQKRRKIQRLHKFVSALSACFVLGISLNFFTLSVFGTNLFESAVNFTKDGAIINLLDGSFFFPSTYATTTTAAEASTVKRTESAHITTAIIDEESTDAVYATTAFVEEQSTDIPESTPNETVSSEVTKYTDYYSIIGNIIGEKCAEYDIFPYLSIFKFADKDIPTKLEEFYFEETELSKDLYLTFSDNTKQLDFSIEQYYNSRDIPNVLIPTTENKNDVEMLDYKGLKIYVISGNGYKTAAYVIDEAVYTITGYNISDDVFYSLLTDLELYFPPGSSEQEAEE